MSEAKLSSGALLAAASQALRENDFAEVSGDAAPELEIGRERLYEDFYSVVLVASYPTAASLIAGWSTAQTNLTRVLSRSLSGGDVKAWEGYLVLLCAAAPTEEEQHLMTRISYDTRRARKLIVTPESIPSDLNMAECLLAILPFSDPVYAPLNLDPLSNFAGWSSHTDEERSAIEALLSANERNLPLMQALEDFVGGRS